MARITEAEFKEILKNPYRDDPQWEESDAYAVDAQGGPDEESSSEEEDSEAVGAVTLPADCVCQHCR